MYVVYVGICVYRYNVHEMGVFGGRGEGGRDVWRERERGEVWREGEKLDEWEMM